MSTQSPTLDIISLKRNLFLFLCSFFIHSFPAPNKNDRIALVSNLVICLIVVRPRHQIQIKIRRFRLIRSQLENNYYDCDIKPKRGGKFIGNIVYLNWMNWNVMPFFSFFFCLIWNFVFISLRTFQLCLWRKKKKNNRSLVWLKIHKNKMEICRKVSSELTQNQNDILN